MNKKIKWILVVIVMMPVLFYVYIFGLLYWDSLGYKKFQEDVRIEFLKLNSDNLKMGQYACHEWKCHIDFVDPKMDKYGFSIFGKKEIKTRLELMQKISKDFEANRSMCRYIQEGTNLCQL